MKTGMKFRKMMMAAAAGMMILAGCGSSGGEEKKADSGKEVLKVGVECAYPPFNWTQTEETTTSGKEAEPIYGTSQYAYGYDVAVAQKWPGHWTWTWKCTNQNGLPLPRVWMPAIMM